MAPAKVKSRRGRKPSGEVEADAKPAETKSRSKKASGDIPDEDLSKAASTAAEDLGAPAVMEVLEEFGVGIINELAGKQRAEFMVRLQEERDKED